MHTVSEVAARLGVHPNTVRNLAGAWSVYLSTYANPTHGTPRRFTDNDLGVLQTIVGGQQDKLPRAAIVAMLQQAPMPYIEVPVLPVAPPSAIVAPTTGDSLAVLVDVWQRGQDATTARLGAIERRISTLLVYIAVGAVLVFCLGGLAVLAILKVAGVV